MPVICRNDTAMIARLRERLTDVRYYGLTNEYAGSRTTPEEAWAVFDHHPEASLVQLDALLGKYKIVVDDHHWYGLRPAMEFVPDAPSSPTPGEEAGAPIDPARLFRRAIRGRRDGSTHKHDLWVGTVAESAIALIARSVREAHPDAVLLELVERGDDHEENGFNPAECAIRADGTEIALSATLIDELVTYTVELDGEADWLWKVYIHDVLGPRSSNPYDARCRTFVMDLRAHHPQPADQPKSH